jgi:hypothetical protein
VLLLLAKSFDEYLACVGTKLETIQKTTYFYLIKLIDWKQDRYTVFEISNDPNGDSKGFTMKARNNFKSYSNCTRSLTEIQKA